ncbi:MAG: peptidylprolyl isomerase [Candidatus Aenigmarchaeota archaeon]|nr:peptidylprolyl isomerase [Candidatus Aenigmarchaeota archaeon]
MKSGDFVSIDYVGRVKDSGEIFDSTMEEAAKKENVYDPKISYRPISVVIDANFVIKGLDDALMQMKVGERKVVVIEPKDAFGERNPEYVRAVPASNFKNERIDPTPGSWVTINNVRGKILSADGGRIRIDFNHPLAGKKLEYDVKIVKEITDAAEQTASVVSYITGLEPERVHASIKEREAEIKIDAKREMPPNMKKRIADLEIKWVKGVEKVRFVDEYAADDGKKAEKPAE